MSEEIELKLVVTPDLADALAASGLLAGAPDVAGLVSTYFDTPDHVLRRRGYSLRIRRSKDRCVQTIKVETAAAAGLFARTEWEQPVTGEAPVLDYTTPILAVLGEAAGLLEPVFEVQVERRSWMVDDDGAKIEVVLDRGEIVAGERRAAICELEFELKAGQPAALFALARRLNALVPMRLGVLSKAERGYDLTGPIARSFKARPVALAADMTEAQAFEQVVRSCLRQFRLNEALLLADRNVEALHQARVALRRLRCAFAIFKPLVGTGTGPRLREELRWIAGELGLARNLDVLIERAEPGELQDIINSAREQAYDRIDACLQSPRARALMLGLAEWIALGDWHGVGEGEPAGQGAAREFAVQALDRARRKVRKSGRDVIRASDEARHALRKEAKKLRYAAEFFAGLFPDKREKRRMKKFLAALGTVQDQLGALNDLATTPAVLGQLGIANAPGAAALLGRDRKKALLEAAADGLDELLDVKRFWR